MHESFYTASVGSVEPTYWNNAARLFNTEMVYPTQAGGYRTDAMHAKILPWQDCVTGENVTLWREYYDGFNAMVSRAIQHHNKYAARLTSLRQKFKDNINSANAVARYNLKLYHSFRMAGREVGQTLGALLHNLYTGKISAEEFVGAVVWHRSMARHETSSFINAFNAHHSSRVMGNKSLTQIIDELYRNDDKLRTGEWQKLPTQWREFLDNHRDLHLDAFHQPHVSESDPSMLAYTQSVDKLLRGIQTKIKPGRYLAKYYPNLSQEDIKRLSERWETATQGELKFVENDDPDGWVEVYRDGPDSCMQGESCVRVYALKGNGLRLAYYVVDDEIVARAIVREDANLSAPKQYVRVYPNCDTTEKTLTHNRFKSLLESLGYVHGNLDGVRLSLEWYDRYEKAIVMPYLDYGNGGTQNFDVYDDHVKVKANGDYCADNTCGYVETRRHTCDCCGESFSDEDDLTWVESGEESVCNDCLSEHYTYAYGRRYEEYFPSDDVIYCESDGNYYVEQWASNHDVYQCAHNGNWYSIDDLVMCDVGKYEGDYIHSDYAKQDEITEEWAHESEFSEDEAGITTFDDYLRSDFITGDDYHKDTMVQIHVAKKLTLWIHPDNLTAESIVEHFVQCGDKLYPVGYYGNTIAQAFEPANVDYPDHGDYEAIEDLLTDGLPEQDESDEDFPCAPVVWVKREYPLSQAA